MTGTIFIENGNKNLRYIIVEDDIIQGANDPKFEQMYIGIKIIKAEKGKQLIISPKKKKEKLQESAIRGIISRIEEKQS